MRFTDEASARRADCDPDDPMTEYLALQARLRATDRRPRRHGDWFWFDATTFGAAVSVLAWNLWAGEYTVAAWVGAVGVLNVGLMLAQRRLRRG